MDQDEHRRSPSMVFLAGPPGAGKTSLGSHVCRELGLRFLDLSATHRDTGQEEDLYAVLTQTIDQRAADVTELPWPLQMAGGTFPLCRRHGQLIALWAHPLDMQARSSHAEPLFTSDSRLKTRGGFGLRGTRCPEFKRINRACQTTLMLAGLPFDLATAELMKTIESLRAEENGLDGERNVLGSWARAWQQDLNADKTATEVLVDAIAQYTWQLQTTGASPRTMSAQYDDLSALGYLVLAYDTPKGKKILSCLSPYEYEYKRRFSDSPALVARYQHTVEDFCRFLQKIGLVSSED